MRLTAVTILLFSALAAVPISAETVTIEADRDNTLYEEADGALSNGAGSYLFVGATNRGDLRRALLHFDVASAVPAGATIDAASLTLTMSKTNSGEQSVEIHECLVGWGEGSSDASGEEGGGTGAVAGDATWIHSAFSGSPWTTAGGDFSTAVTATATVGDAGPYTWGTAELAADVQGWLDGPSSNFGWILLGNESSSRTAKRFGSRENASADTRPLLTVDYSVPPPTAIGSSTWGAIKSAQR